MICPSRRVGVTERIAGNAEVIVIPMLDSFSSLDIGVVFGAALEAAALIPRKQALLGPSHCVLVRSKFDSKFGLGQSTERWTLLAYGNSQLCVHRLPLLA